MSKQKYISVDLSKVCEFISVADLPYGTSLFAVTTKTGEWCVSVEKNACNTVAHVWHRIQSANGHFHSRYDRDTECHSAILGNSAVLYGYFIDDFARYSDAQHYVRDMMHVSGIDLREF